MLANRECGFNNLAIVSGRAVAVARREFAVRNNDLIGHEVWPLIGFLKLVVQNDVTGMLIRIVGSINGLAVVLDQTIVPLAVLLNDVL